MMTDDDLRQLMTECVDRLKPFPPGTELGSQQLAFTIGFAAGALTERESHRPLVFQRPPRVPRPPKAMIRI